jgi:hypothetical protein
VNKFDIRVFAATLMLHAGFLAWALPQPGSLMQKTTASKSPASFKVFLSPEKKQQPIPPSTPRPSPAAKPDRPILEKKMAAIQPQPVQEADQLAHVPTYYPLSALNQVPTALDNFSPDLPAVAEQNLQGKVTIRLWINETGGIDRLDALDSE